MKKIYILLAIMLSSFGFSQDVYGGFYTDGETARPYLYHRFHKSDGHDIDIHSVIGLGWNTFNNINATVGVDLVVGNGLVRPMLGLGVRFLGYVDMYKDYLPDGRIGVEIGKLKIIGTVNWDYENDFINPPLNYTGLSVYKNDTSKIVSKTPIPIPAVGIFYNF